MIVNVFALLLNKKIFFVIFSGVWRISITCCQASAVCVEQISKRVKIICFVGLIFV